MYYNNEEVITVNNTHMTSTHKRVISYFDYDMLNSTLADFISVVLELSQNLYDTTISFDYFEEGEWNFSLIGWRKATDEEKAAHAAELTRREEALVEREKRMVDNDRKELLGLAAKYGIELPELPEKLAVVSADETENANPGIYLDNIVLTITDDQTLINNAVLS